MIRERVFSAAEVPAVCDLLDVPPEQVERVRVVPGRFFVDLRSDAGPVTLEIPLRDGLPSLVP